MDFYETDDYYIEDIIFWINRQLHRAGKGYVNPKVIEYESERGNIRVWVNNADEIVGIAIMSKNKTLWNLIVSESKRGHGIGTRLLEIIRPETVRVKAKPVGHLSKSQLEAFEDPTEWYEKRGYEIIKWDHAQNILSSNMSRSKKKSILLMRRKITEDEIEDTIDNIKEGF